MNIEERNRTLAIIEQIEKYNFSKEVAKHFNNSTEIDSIAIGPFPVKEFISFFNRAISQLKAELQTDNYFFYPVQGSVQAISGIHIISALDQILTCLQQNQIPQIVTYLNQLVTYEYYFNFWHLSLYKTHNLKGFDFDKRKSEIDFLKKRLENSINNYQAKINELDLSKKQVVDFLILKQQELAQITNNQTRSTTETQQISKLLQDSQKANSDLNSILAVQTEKLNDIKKALDEQVKAFNNYEDDAIELEQKLKISIESAESKLNSSQEKLDFIESKKDDIVRLVGLAADGVLGYKFDDRQVKLGKSLIYWKWMVPGITVLSIIWVVIVFTCLSAHTGVYWQDLVINIFKTFPVFILMGFVFRQYNRERNLQEEYAFKSAVAMTITAYSEMLKDQDTDGNTTRQEMLINAIKEVYDSSKLQPETKQKIISFNTKDLKETVEHLTEALGEVKNITK